MTFKRPIYRFLFYTAWLVVIGGIVTLLVAANKKSQARTCKGVEVTINNGGDRIYVEKTDVLKTIEKTAKGSIIGRHNGDVNLASLEKNLETNPWIRDAELYFDTKNVLHVSVSERLPVARVFTTSGASFYIDSAGYQMPLLETYSAKLPVVTGFPAAKRLNAADSSLLQQTRAVIQAVSGNSFWNAQVGQIDITPEGKFELIPVVGNHVIKLGTGTDVTEKLERLFIFYKQVLPKAGFAKYSALDLQFDGQVVAVKRGQTSAVDSLQLAKNIEDLMERKMAEQEPDVVVQPVTEPVQTVSGDIEEPLTTRDTVTGKPAVLKGASTTPVNTTTPRLASNHVNTAIGQSGTVKKPTPNMAAVKKPAAKPKAVMQKKAENEY